MISAAKIEDGITNNGTYEWKHEYNIYKIDDALMNEVNPEMRRLKEISTKDNNAEV